MVEVTVDDRARLESWIRATTTEQRLVLRARIILALAQGRTNREVAEELSIRPATVSKWRTRFATNGIGGLADAPRSGKCRVRRDGSPEAFVVCTGRNSLCGVAPGHFRDRGGLRWPERQTSTGTG